MKKICRHCNEQLDKLVSQGLFSKHDISFLREPRRVFEVSFPARRDDGSTKYIDGYRVQYNDSLGPTKGGIRIHESANLEEVTELAFLMTLKTALLGLPYGGAKGAIQINPTKLSEKEFKRVVRSYITQIAHIIGSEKDIPAPDVNVTQDTIALMLEAYKEITETDDAATFTGKPYALGGSLGREASTSRGGFYILEACVSKKKLSEKRIAIQGFGNVGSNLALFLHEAGARVVAVSDSKTGLFNKDGLPIPELIKWKKEGRPFSDRSEKKITNKKLLELDVDVVAPSALGGVITNKNAKNVQAQTILEMANAPVDPSADEVLLEKGITVIPDILGNAGGVVVSYFEWLQNKEDESWTNKRVNEKLRIYMRDAYKAVCTEQSKRPHLSMRTLCYIIAIKRLIEAEKEYVKKQ